MPDSMDARFPEMRWFVLPLNPTPWAVGPLSVGRKGGKVFPQMGRNQQLRAYQDSVREELALRYPEFQMIPGEEYELVFYFRQMSEKYERTGRRTSRSKFGDLTNLVKATEDAIQGLLIENDVRVRKQTNFLENVNEEETDLGPHVVIGVAQYHGFSPADMPPIVHASLYKMWREGSSWVAPTSDTDGELPF